VDNLVLVRVAAALEASLAGAVLRDLREEAPGRIRLAFEAAERPRTVVVCLRPEEPWIGRPVLRAREVRGGAAGHAAAFVAQARKALAGTVVRAVLKPGIDRVLRVDFADGHALVAELATHRANLLLLERGDRILGSARRPRSASERVASGAVYRLPDLPAGLLVPTRRPADVLDAYIEDRLAGGEQALEVLRRHVFGLGTEAARLILAEAAASGSSLGHVLAERLGSVERGEADPVIDGPVDLLERVREEGYDARESRLLPWAPPPCVAAHTSFLQRQDAAATAGLYHEARDLWRGLCERRVGLRAVLARERDRLGAAEAKARSDQRSFEDPERHRRQGEALLAGIATARRAGGNVLVPDPYAADETWIAVPVEPGRSLGDAASDCFRAYRRARRGVEQAARRVMETAERRRRLEALDARYEGGACSEGELDRFEQALREAGIPVGLARSARRRERDLPPTSRPRLEGVRVYRTATGATLLVGKSARENHRLTFRIAAPEDFWLHAAGRRGAHVVLRNEERAAKPPQRALEEAAAAAAWFSEGKDEAWVDVHWTRRKHVRRARGAAPGTVLLKRFETLRVRPAVPVEVLTPLGG
jgi:predicted ribosome quality control (RQC) complex YloA/Tae2 family protein